MSKIAYRYRRKYIKIDVDNSDAEPEIEQYTK